MEWKYYSKLVKYENYLREVYYNSNLSSIEKQQLYKDPRYIFSNKPDTIFQIEKRAINFIVQCELEPNQFGIRFIDKSKEAKAGSIKSKIGQLEKESKNYQKEITAFLNEDYDIGLNTTFSNFVETISKYVYFKLFLEEQLIALKDDMTLTGKQKKQFDEAFLSAFNSYTQLQRLLDFELDVDLNTISNPNKSLPDVVMDIRIWAIANDKIKGLLKGALEMVPGNQKLITLEKELFSSKSQSANNVDIEHTLNDFQKRRIAAINKKLETNYRLLEEYEEQKDLESDPKRKMNQEKQINEIKENIKKAEQELVEIQANNNNQAEIASDSIESKKGEKTYVEKNEASVSGNGKVVIQGVQGSNINIGSQNSIKSNEDAKKDLIKILFMAAQPDDQQRLTMEFDDIREKVKESIKNGELDFLHPTWETDYEALLLRLKDDKPNVLHYSGHSTPEGVCLKNKVSGDTQLLENDELSDIFEGKSRYLKLVILNSCFSAVQAQIISKEGIYVLGLKDEVEIDIAKALAERFYLGFRVQEPPIKIEKAIKIGCKNFAKTYTKYADLISVWKDGIEIDYKSL